MWDVGCGVRGWGCGIRSLCGKTPSTVARLLSSVTTNSELTYNIVYFNDVVVERKSHDTMAQ